MTTIYAKMAEAASNMDRTRALIFGILSGVSAFFALWKIFWLVFGTAIFSGLGYAGSGFLWVAVSLVWWVAIAALGTAWAIVFLRRYSAQP